MTRRRPPSPEISFAPDRDSRGAPILRVEGVEPGRASFEAVLEHFCRAKGITPPEPYRSHFPDGLSASVEVGAGRVEFAIDDVEFTLTFEAETDRDEALRVFASFGPGR